VATEIKVPDIGDFKDVPIIEIHVKPGDAIKADDPLVSLESDKATMDVPAVGDGTVEELLVKVGDKVSEGSPILRLKADGAGAPAQPPEAAPLPSVIAQQEPTPPPKDAAPPPAAPAKPATGAPPVATAPATAARAAAASDPATVHASPGVRRLARELEVDLAKVKGTGEKGRITKEDVRAFLKGPAVPAAAPAGAAAAPTGGMGIPEIPAQDFSKFGPVETRPLARIKRISGPFLHRAWLNIPHVTHGDEADITEIEQYRKELDTEAKADKKSPYRVSLLPFLMKASVSALRAFPEFNSSLSPEKDALIYKRYYNIGIAVDTPEGLVVPVVKDVDRKGIVELSRELGSTSAKARDGKLGPAEMQGGTFTISSLGGIGGTAFTPIVNAPEVAILGVVRSKTAPVWDGEAFKPRTMLPVFVSYDHRVIDGALAARFARHLCTVLEDVRRLIL
jgi:pyruvate dehydrogenase E2 component (dihydrolipoamide acetyltransferase)